MVVILSFSHLLNYNYTVTIFFCLSGFGNKNIQSDNETPKS